LHVFIASLYLEPLKNRILFFYRRDAEDAKFKPEKRSFKNKEKISIFRVSAIRGLCVSAVNRVLDFSKSSFNYYGKKKPPATVFLTLFKFYFQNDLKQFFYSTT